jgi:hypothetical protein
VVTVEAGVRKVVGSYPIAGGAALVAWCGDGTLWHGRLTYKDADVGIEWARLPNPAEARAEPVIRAGVVLGPNRRLEDVPRELLRDGEGRPMVGAAAPIPQEGVKA